MKNLQIALGFISALSLSACTNTLTGVGQDLNDANDWAHHRPSAMESFLGRAPKGYADQPAPAATAQQTAPQTLDQWTDADSDEIPVNVVGSGANNELVWHRVDNYDANHPMLLNDNSSSPAAMTDAVPSRGTPEPFKYNESVNLYPVDGEINEITADYAVHGDMAQEIYFTYGSSAISKTERKNLHELGKSLKKSAYDISIVGHASKRVDGVSDPITKKMINLEMAQKRANAVATVLLAAGVNAGSITAVSMGDKVPNEHPGGKTQEAADRRAEVYLDTH